MVFSRSDGEQVDWTAQYASAMQKPEQQSRRWGIAAVVLEVAALVVAVFAEMQTDSSTGMPRYLIPWSRADGYISSSIGLLSRAI